MEHIKLFQGLEASSTKELLSLCKRSEYRGSDVIFDEGDLADSLYVIESGQVIVSKKDNHQQEEILGILEAGEFFGEMALLDQSFRSARITALEQTTLLVLPSDQLEKFLQKNPRAAMSIYRNYAIHLSSRLRSVSDIFQKIAIESKKMKGEIETMVPGMMSAVSNELRSPVALIQSASEVLDDVLMDETHRKKFLAHIRTHTQHLVSLLDDISRLVQIQQQETSVKKESVHVGNVLEQLTTSLRSKAEKKRVMIEIDPKAKTLLVPMHRSHMERVFCHILDHHLKQHHQGGKLSISVDKRDGQQHPVVFITFHDDSKTSTKFDGFSLALVEHLVHAHGGELLFDQKRKNELTVSLPL